MKKYVQRASRRRWWRATSCQYAVAELSTHDNQRVTKALNDGLQAALTGAKTPAQAMRDAQREADAAAAQLQVSAASRRRAPRR